MPRTTSSESNNCSWQPAWWMTLVMTAASVSTISAASPAPPVAPYITAAAATLDPVVQDALRRINGTGPQLLALRSYLRDESLADHWSWTDTQIAAFEGSDEQRLLEMEIDKVRVEFERLNPGFTLFVNPEVRSLERQLGQWNRNKSVAASSAAFERVVSAEIRTNAKLEKVTPASTRAFIALIKQLVPRPAPTLAAPGLSRHGQMRAVDFQIRKGSETVAGADSTVIATRWVAQGWAEKLKVAVVASRASFSGPLEKPDEPWHYEYQPAKDEFVEAGR